MEAKRSRDLSVVGQNQAVMVVGRLCAVARVVHLGNLCPM